MPGSQDAGSSKLADIRHSTFTDRCSSPTATDDAQLSETFFRRGRNSSLESTSGGPDPAAVRAVSDHGSTLHMVQKHGG